MATPSVLTQFSWAFEAFILGSCGPHTEYKTLRIPKLHPKIHFRTENTDQNTKKIYENGWYFRIFFSYFGLYFRFWSVFWGVVSGFEGFCILYGDRMTLTFIPQRGVHIVVKNMGGTTTGVVIHYPVAFLVRRGPLGCKALHLPEGPRSSKNRHKGQKTGQKINAVGKLGAL